VRHQVKEYDIKSLTASKGAFEGKEFPLDYFGKRLEDLV